MSQYHKGRLKRKKEKIQARQSEENENEQAGK